jgi:ferrochelatase
MALPVGGVSEPRPPYDALLLVSFGGPEGPADVMPFLESVLRGRNVPRERMLKVAHHYEHFGGVSPINAQNRALVAALRADFGAHGVRLPVYWGNRNWHPLLPDILRQMAGDGIQHTLAFITSAFSSYSGCRQYREDLARAQAAVGVGAPQITILRKFYNHPGFIAANVAHVRAALEQIPDERRPRAQIAFTAHSIPDTMARASLYERQLIEACRLVADELGQPNWRLVYQSRSGAPGQLWLEPDVADHLRALRAVGVKDVVLAPIGFISDHIEVLYDLDVEARQVAAELGLDTVRAATGGTHPAFVAMIRDLVTERLSGSVERSFQGTQGPIPDACPADCCLPVYGRPATVPAV